MLNLVSFVFVFMWQADCTCVVKLASGAIALSYLKIAMRQQWRLTPQTLEHTDECKHFTKMGHENMSAVVRIYE